MKRIMKTPPKYKTLTTIIKAHNTSISTERNFLIWKKRSMKSTKDKSRMWKCFKINSKSLSLNLIVITMKKTRSLGGKRSIMKIWVIRYMSWRKKWHIWRSCSQVVRIALRIRRILKNYQRLIDPKRRIPTSQLSEDRDKK